MPIVAPAITGGIGLIGNALANRKSSQQKSYEAAATNNLNQQTSLAKTLGDTAQGQYALTKPALSQAIGLYSKLAGGDRSMVQSTIAPDVAAVNDAYAGNEKYLEQQGVRGGVRDTQLAEANRQKTGQIGMLPFLARNNAISGLATLGSTGTSAAMSGMAGAAGAAGSATANAGNLAQQNFGREQTVGGQVAGFGSNLMQMMIPYLLQRGKGGGGGEGMYGIGGGGGSSTPDFSSGIG